MSDSDSASDSDISQGWTMVGPDGVVDSSDPDSDIVILKDEEEIRDQTGSELERDEPGNQHSDELDMHSREPACRVTLLNVEPRIDGNMEPDQEVETQNMEPQLESKTTSMEPDDRAKDVSMESECKAEIACCMEPEREIATTLQPECKVENVTRERQDEYNARVEEEEEKEDKSLLAVGANMDTEVAIDERLAEEAETSEPSMEWISSLEIKEADAESALLSTSCHFPLHNFVTFAQKQKSQTEGVPLSSLRKNNDGSDADASDDDTDNEESDTDDESVVRKFHEATFHLNQRPGDRIEMQQNNEEDEVVPPDVDDRCESDISGVADDSDSDLSSLAGIDDLQLNVGEVVRSYRHQPNPTFNSRLTLVAVITVLFALGIGIGHYIGTTRGSSFHQQQILRLKTLQDEYFVCLRDTEKLESKLAKAMDSSPNEKIAAVMAVWRKKYEELVLERAELEYRLNQGQENMKQEPEQEHKQENVEDLEEHKQQLGEEKNQKAEKEPVQEKEEQHKHGRERETDLTIAEKLLNSSVKNSSMLLHSEVVQCCHQVIALTADLNKKNVDMDQLRNDANQLIVENSELKAAILSQRYSEHPGNSGIDASERGDTELHKGPSKQPESKPLEDDSYADKQPKSTSLEDDSYADRQPKSASLEDVSYADGQPKSASLEDVSYADRQPKSASLEDVSYSDKHPDSKPFEDNSYADKQPKSTSLEDDSYADKQPGIKAFNSYAVREHASQDLRFPEVMAYEQMAQKNMALGHNNSELEISVGTYNQKKTGDITPQPIVISLIQVFISPAVKSSERGFPDNKSLGALVNCFATLKNVSVGHSFYDLLLHNTWSQLKELVTKVDLITVANQWELVLGSCRDFIDIETSQSYIKVNINSDSSAKNETSQQVNKLREIVKKLDVAVQGTVKSMNKLSGDSQSPRARLKAKNAIENWSRKMLSDWKKIDESVFQIRGKEAFSESKKKVHERLENLKIAAKNRGTLDQRSVGEKSKQAFEGNRDHKQTESSSSHQKYEEFWRWNHFDPDDFLQEGFFEDNQREWHKHQKRLRKISGRIQRLTEEMLMSMDDDDVEDIYEDVEDFIEDMEDREIPERLRTWLTCQARWWRSRVQRKHRNEDLVKGCGQQLVHWQLRVLCKESGHLGRRCRERSKFCKAVIASQGGSIEKGKGKEQNQGMKRNNIGFGSNKISSSMGRSAGKSFQSSAPKKSPNVNSMVKHDGKKVAFGKRSGSGVDYKTEKISRDNFATKNQTFANHGAYDNLGPSFFQWSQSCRHVTGNRYAGNLAEGRHYVEWLRQVFFHQPDNRRKTQMPSFHGNSGQDGRMLRCRGNEEFNSYLEMGQKYCRK